MDATGSLPLIAFARRLGVDHRTVRRWAREGLRGVRLVTIRRGGRLFVAWSDYLDWQRRVDAWQAPRVEPTPKGRARDVARCMAELLA